MFLTLSAIHLCLLSFLGSWLSWKKHFRWAVNYNYIKAFWIIFRCQNSRHLVVNILIYALFFNSSHTGKNEIIVSLCYIYNLFCLNYMPDNRLANSEWCACWSIFAALSLSTTFAYNIYRKVFVTEKTFASIIVFSILLSTSITKAIPCIILPVMAMVLSKFIQSPSAKFRCIKKLEKFIDPSVLAVK